MYYNFLLKTNLDNAAQRLGWVVYRVTAGMLKDDPAGVVEMVREAL